jgi:hypothetical protein
VHKRHRKRLLKGQENEPFERQLIAKTSDFGILNREQTKDGQLIFRVADTICNFRGHITSAQNRNFYDRGKTRVWQRETHCIIAPNE